MVDKIGNFLGNTYRNVAKGFMTTLKESKFYEEGVLTPEEFVKAGDYLTTKCPTWKWCSNKNSISPVDYLPKEKQFLQTTVPCINRVKNYVSNSNYKENDLEDDWCEPDFNEEKKKNKNQKNSDLQEVDLDNIEGKNKKVIVEIDNYIENVDGIEAIEEVNMNNKEIEVKNDEDFMIIEVEDEKVVKSRTYDVTITYDYYYRVPRLYLIGYSEFGAPLSNEEVKEDIMLEYVDKTVTIEKHPNLGSNSVSIHPCKHSHLLKTMIDNFEKNGKKLEVERSIVLFLKFLSSVVPTIKYDFTMDVDFQ